jgi:transcriptional regulator with XRE-family HTH domain
MTVDASEIDAHVGSRIRRRRESLGISQARLGNRLGLTFSQVQKYEKGTNRIGAGRLLLVAEALKVPVEYFFEGLHRTEANAELAHDPAGARSDEKVELGSVVDALMTIRCKETRESLMALVLSLANAPSEEEKPKRRASH